MLCMQEKMRKDFYILGNAYEAKYQVVSEFLEVQWIGCEILKVDVTEGCKCNLDESKNPLMIFLITLFENDQYLIFRCEFWISYHTS